MHNNIDTKFCSSVSVRENNNIIILLVERRPTQSQPHVKLTHDHRFNTLKNHFFAYFQRKDTLLIFNTLLIRSLIRGRYLCKIPRIEITTT